jgi:hypothetical protein
VRERVVHAKLQAAPDDLGLGEIDQRRQDAQPPALDASLGGQPREMLERAKILGATVGIAGVIQRIHTNDDGLRADHFRPGKRQRQKHGVPRGHIGGRDVAGVQRPVLRNDAIAHQRRAADLGQRDVQLEMTHDTKRLRNIARRFDLARV